MSKRPPIKILDIALYGTGTKVRGLVSKYNSRMRRRSRIRLRVIDEKIKIASTKDAIKVLKYKILGLMNNVEILQEENLYIIREQKKRSQPEASPEQVFTELIHDIQTESGKLVTNASESVERVVANTYADAIATCMELAPPARDAAAAIEKRQRETLGTKEPSEGAKPIGADLWVIGEVGE